MLKVAQVGVRGASGLPLDDKVVPYQNVQRGSPGLLSSPDPPTALLLEFCQLRGEACFRNLGVRRAPGRTGLGKSPTLSANVGVGAEIGVETAVALEDVGASAPSGPLPPRLPGGTAQTAPPCSGFGTVRQRHGSLTRRKRGSYVRPAASLLAEQGRADPLRSTRRGPPCSTVQRMAVGVEFSNNFWHSLGLRL